VKVLLVLDNPKRWPIHLEGVELVEARAYLTEPKYATMTRARVLNLCRSYRYQTVGHYVSLLAEARSHRPLPSIATIQDLRLQPVIRVSSNELDEVMQKSLAPLKSDSFELSIYFGSNLAQRYRRLSLALFNRFPAPLLRASFVRDDKWRLDGVRLLGAGEIPENHRAFALVQARRYLEKPHRPHRTPKPAKYDLAILRNPEERLPPSDERALQRFVRAGEKIGLGVDLITREDYGRLAEYDALFIRETTGVNHHTFRFARRATAEGMVVIDEPESILRCTNKVYLAELLERHRIATPQTVIVAESTKNLIAERIGFPCVVKAPDSAFSVGVVKFDTREEFEAAAPQMFEDSELLLAQEFVPTDFDWRIGVLNGEPLYACKYYMARKHWQIYQHEGGTVKEGTADTLPVQDAPHRVVRTAVKAANLIGDGLYGVDIKVIGGRPRVIEINDNPSIDSGVEDRVLKDTLYERIMRVFLERLDARRR
jgi:glutathione synthase/RimK-type ligase-like ATP-grasp enzyme